MEAVLTVRLDKHLKQRGAKVMEENGMTPSQAVRRLFDYAATNDSLPFTKNDKPSKAEIAKRIAAFDKCHTKRPLSMNDDELRAERLANRYEVDA